MSPRDIKVVYNYAQNFDGKFCRILSVCCACVQKILLRDFLCRKPSN